MAIKIRAAAHDTLAVLFGGYFLPCFAVGAASILAASSLPAETVLFWFAPPPTVAFAISVVGQSCNSALKSMGQSPLNEIFIVSPGVPMPVAAFPIKYIVLVTALYCSGTPSTVSNIHRSFMLVSIVSDGVCATMDGALPSVRDTNVPFGICMFVQSNGVVGTIQSGVGGVVGAGVVLQAIGSG